MLYVIAFFVPPAALFLAGKPFQAAIAFVCFVLACIGVVVMILPGLILYFFPIFLLWFSTFWFAPATYAFAVVKARKSQKRVPERADYAFALRRLAVTLLLIIVIPVTGRVLYWFYAAHRLRAELAQWSAAPDYMLHWDNATINGFPFVVRLRLTNATFRRAQPLPYALNAPLMTIETAPWIGYDLHVEMAEGANLEVPALGVVFDAAAIDVGADFGEHNRTSINFTAHQVAGGEAAAGLRIGTVDGDVLMPGTHWDAGNDYLLLNASFNEISLPWALPPLSDTIKHAQIYGDLNRPWPPGPLREALATWRDSGGSIALLGKLWWGNFEVSLSHGMLTLDAALQPVGSFRVAAENGMAAIDAIVAAGGLSAPEADAAKVALGRLTEPKVVEPRDPAQEVHIGNDRLTLGAAKLLALPRVAWP